MLYRDDQDQAGPSTRPYGGATIPTPAPTFAAQCELGAHCPLLPPSTALPIFGDGRAFSSALPGLGQGRKRKRQGRDTEFSSSAMSSATSLSTSDASSSSDGLFVGPSLASNSTWSSSSSSSAFQRPYYQSTVTSFISITSTRPFIAPWTRTSSAKPENTYVPGLMLNLTLAGNSDSEAVYSVPMTFGHGVQNGSDSVLASKWKRDSSTGSDLSGTNSQVVDLQVDLGSSDMWVASDACTTVYCSSAPRLYDASQSLDANVSASLVYQSGSVSGEVYWEEVELGGFGVPYQAFVLADTVDGEDLSGGSFTGVLGLALPASSIILSEVSGTTGSDPDGATFLDNLFGSGEDAPTQKLFSLSLGRREDIRTSSFLGIGAVSTTLCPSPCSPPYLPIIAKPSLGAVGFLHWRIQLQSISAMTWNDPQHASGMNTTTIALGSSQVDAAKSSPLAVLDSGGVAILVGYKPYADAIYAAYGISASSDGYYRMPCTQQIALTFTFAGQQYPVHPLDMSWPDPSDLSQTTCIGAIQYSSNLGDTGDFILGSAFLKNVYSIFQYPSTNKTNADSWQPTVGLIPLTNASVASQDFYAVRSMHESLASVSAAQESTSDTSSSAAASHSSAGSAAAHKAVSTAVVAAVSVVGFFAFAAIAFSAWWFWIRRKAGSGGAVDYRSGLRRSLSPGHRSDLSSSSLRSRKHDFTQRQKSMVEGYSDYESDSWLSKTEGGDSMRMGYLPELLEEDEGRMGRGDARSSLVSSQRESKADLRGENEKDANLVDISEGGGVSSAASVVSEPPTSAMAPLKQPKSAGPSRREMSPSANRNVSLTSSRKSNADPQSSRSATSAYPQPNVPHSASGRSISISMAGPFPSAPRHSLMRPDSSPMYDIRSSDYFKVVPGSSAPASGQGRESRRVRAMEAKHQQDGSGDRDRRKSPHRNGGLAGTVLTEEEGDLSSRQEKG